VVHNNRIKSSQASSKMSSQDSQQPTDLSSPVHGSKSVLKHTDTVGALPSMESSPRIQAAKKLSHPGPMSTTPRISVGQENTTNPRVRGTICNFIPCIPDGGFRIKKKASKEVAMQGGRKVYGEEEEEENHQVTCSVTHSLESAVRKLSRTSPNRSDLSGIRAGLAILARGYEQYREGIQLLRPTEFGEASSDDLSSEWESAELENNNNSSGGSSPVRRFPLPLSPDRPVARQKGGLSAWRKVRNVVQWTPFIQTFKARRYPWVQLAGHSGNFRAGQTQGTVLKKLCPQEECVYKKLMKDEFLKDFVPKFHQTIILDDDDQFIELEDCLSSFSTSPCIMDCKIGIRTYLEEELAKAREKPKLRKDMYEKMVAVDPDAPTEQEHLLKGVTKPRYMVWRETISSTATLGFRIEGIKKDGNSSKDFKTTSTKEQVIKCFYNFIQGYPHVLPMYLQRLEAIRDALEHSSFFNSHELIGSSLLFVHDEKKANIWLIDFGKTVSVPENLQIDHKSAWEVGNHEDGYLIGLDCIVNIFKQFTESV